MWMTTYIGAILRAFRDSYGFMPERTVGGCPAFAPGQIPDGVYPMVIEGKIDYIKMKDDTINCCNFDGAPA